MEILQMTKTERTIAGVWAEVLPLKEQVRPEDNFFTLGGTSIDMVMALFRMSEEFRIKLPDSAIFDAPSVRELSGIVDTLLTKAGRPGIQSSK
jgi:glycopeptidolipid biosynthesis protein